MRWLSFHDMQKLGDPARKSCLHHHSLAGVAKRIAEMFALGLARG
jgi:hypothetical protein